MVAACGSNEDDAGSATSASTTAPKAGSGSQSSSEPKTTTAPNIMVTCGGEMCAVNLSLRGVDLAAEACCTSDGKCGQTDSEKKCREQNAEGVKDTSCPDVHVTAIGMDFVQVGCCTPKGECGALFEQVGWGCVPGQELLADMGGPLEAKTCGAKGPASP
jgi:hypothetical protein